jgi:hypothetical protein
MTVFYTDIIGQLKVLQLYIQGLKKY